MQKKLTILWTNDNVLTAEHMVLMYASRTLKVKMWDEITVVIWGATAKLVAENTHIQGLIAQAQKVGVKFSACTSCAENLDTTDALKSLDIELKGWGKPLTAIIQNKENLLTL